MGSVWSTGLCVQDKNSRQQPPSHWIQTVTFRAEFKPELGSSTRTMEVAKMTLNLKTLLLTMMMFKWGKNSFRVVCLCAGMPRNAVKKLLNFILVAYLNVFISFSGYGSYSLQRKNTNKNSQNVSHVIKIIKATI